MTSATSTTSETFRLSLALSSAALVLAVVLAPGAQAQESLSSPLPSTVQARERAQQINTPGVAALWDFGYGASIDSQPHLANWPALDAPAQSAKPPVRYTGPVDPAIQNLSRGQQAVRNDFSSRWDFSNGADIDLPGNAATEPKGRKPRLRPRGIPDPTRRTGSGANLLPVVNPDSYHRAVFLGGEGPALAIDTACSINAAGFNWRAIKHYEKLRDEYPKGADFWVEVEVTYGNKSGQPNALACPGNDQFFASPMNGGVCILNYRFRDLGTVQQPPPAPDLQSRCVQTRQMRLKGTGKVTGDYRLTLTPATQRVQFCELFELGATITASTQAGGESSFARPVRWALGPGIQEATTFGATGAGDGRTRDVRTLKAIRFGSHKVQVHLEDDSIGQPLSASAIVDVAMPAPAALRILPAEAATMVEGDEMAFTLEGLWQASCHGAGREHVQALDAGVVWSASRGSFSGNVYRATEPGPVEITASWIHPYSLVRYETRRSLEVEKKDQLVVALEVEQARIDTCGTLRVVPRVSTQSGRPLEAARDQTGADGGQGSDSGDGLVNLAFDWSTSGPGPVERSWEGPSSGAPHGTFLIGFAQPGSYSFSARVRGTPEEVPAGQAEVEVVDMTPLSVEVLPSETVIDVGDLIEIDTKVTFPVRPESLPGFTPQDPEILTIDGTVRGTTFWSTKPGTNQIAAVYRPDSGCGGAEVSGWASVEVHGEPGGAHVDAWVTHAAKLPPPGTPSFGDASQ